MRKRVKASGKTYYYLDTGGTPRKEIPLGSDYIAALRKYADLHKTNVPAHKITFGDVMTRYKTDVLPSKTANTIRVFGSDIKHLEKYFANAPLEQMRPMHIAQFMDKMKHIQQTGRRCKAMISLMWNQARVWGYTDKPNPCLGVRAPKSKKRDVYITDDVFNAVRNCGSDALKDAMDLAYLTGQRPADAMKLTERDIEDGYLVIRQSKTRHKMRIAIVGELALLMARIRARKDGFKIHHTNLLVNSFGKPLRKEALRGNFEKARAAAAEKYPKLADQIRAMWFYDLRAKAADDTAELRGELEASHLLGHEDVRTTQRHYLRRGKQVKPTK